MSRQPFFRPPMSKAAVVREPILVVDDEADLRELLEISLRRMGHDVVLAGGLAEAREALTRQRFALVLTDMRLGDGLGIDLVRQLSATADRTPVAVITAYGSAENAVEALKAGAFDYIAKPLSLDQLRSLVLNALGRQQRDPDPGSADLAERTSALLPGHSAAMQEVRRSLLRLARSMAPVVISGESGSGKERAARAIHALSSRSARPFVAVNCGAIPENLMEAEFFGYVKGAFTGADSDRQGFFQAAHGGTLMLDEVADLPLTMQVKLLRALQERRVRKIGESREDPVDVRVVCASHQNLARLVAAGRFREDLFYRLNVLELRMPTLRERAEDVPVLAGVLLEQLAARYGDPRPKRLTRQALQQLCAYPFPGNVRELDNLLERAYAFAEGESIDVDHLGALGTDIERSPLFHRARGAWRPSRAPGAPAAGAGARPSRPSGASRPCRASARRAAAGGRLARCGLHSRAGADGPDAASRRRARAGRARAGDRAGRAGHARGVLAGGLAGLPRIGGARRDPGRAGADRLQPDGGLQAARPELPAAALPDAAAGHPRSARHRSRGGQRRGG